MRALTLTFAFASALFFTAACVHQEANQAPAPVKSYSFEETPAELVGYRDRAKGAFEAVGKRLIPRLTGALAEGGPAAAVKVCREVAQPLTDEAGKEVGFAVGRTSHKLRNPANASRDWIKQLVQDSAGRKGAEVKPMVFDLGDRVGVASPIVAVEMCLQCHGTDEQLKPEVKQILAEQYPDDQARGFASGDLRGWFWAELPKK
ncbi:MAG: DUF3365 domain-containing protein [Planctomycetes bacterium]|nr:DUF3365 domain-containing protein [Planctomycetota bacterium]